MSEHQRQLRDVEFTSRWYRDLLLWLTGRGYRSRGFGGDVTPGDGDLFLRHDVDLSLSAARRMALLEATLDHTATYFVQLTSSLYNPLEREAASHVTRIESLGHDIGLHFSTHRYWSPGDVPTEDELVDRVADERRVLETVTQSPVEAVSFHIPPEWVLGRAFDGFTSAYAPRFFSEIDYVADSGQRWRTQPPFDGWSPHAIPVQLLTHPGLWGNDEPFDVCVETAIRSACQQTKRNTHDEYIEGVYDR